MNLDFLADVERTVEQRARRDCPEPGDGEHAINRQACSGPIRPGRRAPEHVVQFRFQVVQPGARASRYGDDASTPERSRRQFFAHVFAHQVEPFRVVNRIAFAERDHG